MLTMKQKLLIVIFALLIAQSQSFAMCLSARTPDNPTWQDGLELIDKNPELRANVVVNAAIKSYSQNGMSSAQRLLDAAEFLLKVGEVEISEPFFREAWVKAEHSKDASDNQLEKFATRFANVVLNEKAGKRALSYARSEAESARYYLDQAKAWDETAEKREATGQIDIRKPQSASAARETAASFRKQAKPYIAGEAKYRKDAAKAVAEIAKSDLWSRVLTQGKHAYVYNQNFYLSQDLLTMFVKHTTRTTGSDPDIALALRELAKMEVQQKHSAQAIDYYKRVIEAAVKSWRPDSSETLELIGEFQDVFPEQAGAVPDIVADAKKLVDAYDQAAKVEKVRLKPGETKNISSHAKLVMKPNVPVGLWIDSQYTGTASSAAAVTIYPLRKSATLYDDGQRIKVTYRGSRLKKVYQCFESAVPIDADFDIERTKVGVPVISSKPITEIMQIGTPSLFINGTIPAYKLSSNPLVTVFYTDQVYNSSGHKVSLITNYGITEQPNPDNVGDISISRVGPLSITIKRLPNKSKFMMNPLYEVSIKHVSAPTGPRILNIAY